MTKLLMTMLGTLLFTGALIHVHADSHEQGASQEKWNKYTEQWQNRMNTMHEQMDQIHRTTDPEKRKQLLQEHWKTMDEQMADMRMMEGMMGGMMGRMHGRHHDRMHGDKQMMDPEQRDMYMQDRMDMMQMMMEQMMQHNHMMMRDGMH